MLLSSESTMKHRLFSKNKNFSITGIVICIVDGV